MVMEGRRSEQCGGGGGRVYLEEARGHGTTWHGVVGGHVAHHWAGRRRRALEQINTHSFTLKALWFQCTGCSGEKVTIGGSVSTCNHSQQHTPPPPHELPPCPNFNPFTHLQDRENTSRQKKDGS